MSFAIRAMQQQDLERILLMAAEPGEGPMWTRRDYEQVLRPATGEALIAAPWVAYTETGLVGFAVVRWVRGEPAAEIENVLVEQHHRRQGVGTALIQSCLRWATGAGASATRLEVRASNLGALALYRGLGFASAGVRRGYYAGPVEDAFILQAPNWVGGAPD